MLRKQVPNDSGLKLNPHRTVRASEYRRPVGSLQLVYFRHPARAGSEPHAVQRCAAHVPM